MSNLLFMVNNADSGAMDAVITAALLDQSISVLLLGEGLGILQPASSEIEKLSLLQELSVTFYALDTDIEQQHFIHTDKPVNLPLSTITNRELPNFLQAAEHILSF